MNYFAHGYRLIDEPYRLAGASIPDWLNVVDRSVRVRKRHAQPYQTDGDKRMAEVATGVVRHHDDDQWFHATAAFVETCAELTRLLREHLPADDSMRLAFLGHVLVEMLLDATLIQQDPSRLEDYYTAMSAVDSACVEACVRRMTGKDAAGLSTFIQRFCEVQFLRDYSHDDRLVFRLNQIMGRVGLDTLPGQVMTMMPIARRLVESRWEELLGVSRSSFISTNAY
ncbi:MAG: hypothetical protein O2931_05280 [Planctomycetota bacterium]|nr:hypothetical protein [Planctomycetota bacterium]MDA1178195.1 hypothetical protein [Planctomycetota bacterium]